MAGRVAACDGDAITSYRASRVSSASARAGTSARRCPAWCTTVPGAEISPRISPRASRQRARGLADTRPRPYQRPGQGVRAPDLPIRRVRAQDLAVLRRALRQHRHHPVGGHLRGLAAEHGPLADPGPLRPMTSSARRVDPQVITSATKGLENPADHMTGRNARICMSAPSARRLGRRDDIPDIGTRAH